MTKLADKAEAEPPTKKAKTEEKPAAEEKKEEPKKAEPPPELETDAAADKTPKIKENVGFLTQDTTLNVADTMFGNMLSCLTDGGLQNLLAGARASVGMKSGRYLFEVNVVELMHQKQDQTNVTGRVPQPRNFFRLGLSTAGSTLLIGEDEESICFDAEGSFLHNKKKTQVGAKFERCMNVGILVNLDASSPNANTVSVFRDGERICQPQALPEYLKGKVLYPTLTYRNVTVHYNFGPTKHAELPFSCRSWQEMSSKDAVVSKVDVPKDGKYTAVFPVCLPDEGGFQWLDNWLKENPSYTELSDRAILDWAQKSGVARLKPYTQRVCQDKPEMAFGLPTMDDKSIQKMMAATAWMQKRNFVVMEVSANLMKDDRKELVAKFSDFKKVALVVAGEPPKAFKQLTQEAVLKDKQEASNAEFKKKLEEDKKKKAAEKAKKLKEKQKKKEEKAAKKAAEERKKKLQEALKKREEDKKKAEEVKKKAEADKKKAEEEAKKKAEAEAKKKADAEAGVVDLDDADVDLTEEPKEEEDVKMEEVKEEEKKEEVKEEAKEEAKEESEESEEEVEMEEEAPEPPVVELSEEEKKLVFKPCTIPDVTATSLSGNFAKYTLPEKDDGFDEIKYEWANASKAAEHLSAWRQERKVTARMEDLQPSEWFDGKQKEWAKFLQACKQRQNDYKNAVAKRASDKAVKEKAKQMKEIMKKQKANQEKAKKEAKEKAAKEAKEKAEKEKAAKAEAKAKAKAEAIAKGEEPPADEEEEEEEAKPMEVEEEKPAEVEEEEEEPQSEDEPVDMEGVDIFGVQDIMEIGGKPQQPLFSHFSFEDWALMSLRFELNLLVHAFKHDVKDTERSQIHEDNIAFYYQKYYKKGLNPAFFGVKTIKELLKYFEDTLAITKSKVLETFLPCDFEALNVFVLLAEAARRDRARRIDLGEEGAKINMQTAGGTGTYTAGLNAGQSGALQTLLAQRAAGAPTPVTVRPGGPVPVTSVYPGAGPAMVRPPAAWPAQPAWHPVAPAWGPARPVAARPFAGMVRPAGALVQPGWR